MLFHEIETERLLLKNISYEDREFILNEFSNNSINRYLFDAEPLNIVAQLSRQKSKISIMNWYGW